MRALSCLHAGQPCMWSRRSLACHAGHSGGLPFHGERGLNAGILLLSLDRLREASFSRDRDRIIRHFLPRKELPLGDQVGTRT